MATFIEDTLRSAMADAMETNIGASPILEIWAGTVPADESATLTGGGRVLLASMTLPADWLTNASAGAKSLSGTWEDLVADATGDAAFYRIKTSGGTYKLQGTVSQSAASGGTGDLKLSQATAGIVAGQRVGIDSWTFTQGG